LSYEYIFIIVLNINPINMPNFDGTGPAGEGTGTGRGLGKCKDKGQNSQGGFRGRRGPGFCGQGFLKNSAASLDEEEKFLENRLATIRKMKEEN